MPIIDSAAKHYERAMPCNTCFAAGNSLIRPTVSLPQPRWIGPAYETSTPRVAIVALNPGAGSSTNVAANASLLAMLRNYRDGRAEFSEVMTMQAEQMPGWGNSPGRFTGFYRRITERELNQLAFVNLALCATKGNEYPTTLLATCLRDHTSKPLQALKPDVLLLSGSGVHRYENSIQRLLPEAEVILTFHYAHREGIYREDQEMTRVRQLLSCVDCTRIHLA